MKDFEKALIQENNIHWINQKVMEGVNRHEQKQKPTIQFVDPESSGNYLSITAILLAQSFGFIEGHVILDSVDNSSALNQRG